MAGKVYTEEEIQDLTDRVFQMKEQLESGKMHFAEHLIDDFKKSWSAIKLRPDGLVEPTSVDGRIRAATLAVRAMKYREESKAAISLAWIQETYFKLLFRELGWLYDQMVKASASPSDAARLVSNDSDFVTNTMKGLPAFAADLQEFWKNVSEPGAFHLQDGRQLKATFAGDVFPAHWENAVSTAGLYVDTIVLPCPVTRIAPLIGILPDRTVVSLFIKHTLTAMSYRDVAVAEVNPPIAVVLPNNEDIDGDGKNRLIERAKPAICAHGQHLFGRQFESIEELAEFCTSLATVEQVVNALKDSDRLLFDTEWEAGARLQLTRAMTEGEYILPEMDVACAGHHVLSACLGRMPQALAAQENAFHVGGTPLISSETSWRYYTWMLSYEGRRVTAEPERLESMHVVHALTAEQDLNLSWLGNVPPETVIEIRKQGAAEEIRAMLGHGVAGLIGVDPDNYFRTADQVVENLDNAFRAHQQSLLEARQKKLKLYGFDVAGCIAVGGIAVAAALTSNPMLGALSGALGVAGLPNLKDIKTKFREIAEEDRIRRMSPTGLLFRHLK
ncbi:hypothetical protein RVV18_003837 [Burkholderia ambifaria]|nr:hypothetical protein [Burkholderia ambifaria]